MLCIRILIFAFLLAGTCVSSRAETTVNLFVAEPRGGFGDVASNVLMAQKLAVLHPDMRINVIFSEPSAAALQTLLGSSFTPAAMEQNVEGLTLYKSSHPNLPKADYIAAYSTLASAPDEVLATAPLSLLFEEYHSQPIPESKDNRRPSRVFFDEHSRKLAFSFFTGPSASGFYISPLKPAAPMTREALQKELGRALGQSTAFDLEGKLLGFAYTHRYDKTLQYVQAMAIAAKSPRFRDKKIAIVIKNFPELDQVRLDIPPNLEIKRYDSVPFALTKGLIYHSDLPIMVTGDVSMTLAMDYERPFFYELNYWKFSSMWEFANQMVEATKDSGVDAKLMRKAFLLKTKPPLGHFVNPYELRRIQRTDPVNGPILTELDRLSLLTNEEMASLIEDPKFSEASARVYRDKRSTWSLPLQMKKYFEALAPINFHYARPFFTLKQFDSIEAGHDPVRLFASRAEAVVAPETAGRDKIEAISVLSQLHYGRHPQYLVALLRATEDPHPGVASAARDTLAKLILVDPITRAKIVELGEGPHAALAAPWLPSCREPLTHVAQ